MEWHFVVVLCAILFFAYLPLPAHAMEISRGRVSGESFYTNPLKDGQNADLGALRFRLYLPAGYDEHVQLHYPVLYLLHGSNGNTNDTEWDDFFPVLDRMIAQGDIPACIAVAPADGSCCADAGHSGDCEIALISDLIPYIDTKYRTLPDRGKRLIAGYSTGGYCALRCCLAFPKLFEGCVLLNPFVQDGPAPDTSGQVRGSAFSTETGLLEGYAAQAYRVRFYIFATDGDRNHLVGMDGLPKDARLHNNEQQAVNIYRPAQKEPVQTSF